MTTGSDPDGQHQQLPYCSLGGGQTCLSRTIKTEGLSDLNSKIYWIESFFVGLPCLTKAYRVDMTHQFIIIQIADVEWQVYDKSSVGRHLYSLKLMAQEIYSLMVFLYFIFLLSLSVFFEHIFSSYCWPFIISYILFVIAYNWMRHGHLKNHDGAHRIFRWRRRRL